MTSRLFPEEIMNIILGYLSTKDNFFHYRLVCSLWNSRISSLYLEDGLHIQLYESEIPKLASDTSSSAKLAEMIYGIDMLNDTEITDTNFIRGPNNNLEYFVKVVTACPNLARLKFSPGPSVRDYLELLVREQINLPSINEISIAMNGISHPHERILNMKLNLVHCNKITKLKFDYKDVDSEEIGGLYKFITNFRNLKVLDFRSLYGTNSIDIARLMTTACASNLESLRISTIRAVIDVDSAPDDTIDNTKFNNLKSVVIQALSVSNNTLEYIMTNFKNLDTLRVSTRPRNCMSVYKKAEDNSFFEKLISYCNGLKTVKLYIRYKENQEFKIFKYFGR